MKLVLLINMLVLIISVLYFNVFHFILFLPFSVKQGQKKMENGVHFLIMIMHFSSVAHLKHKGCVYVTSYSS